MISYYNISWSPEAEITYARILEYLDEKWTIKEIEAFIARTEEILKHITANPLMYPYSSQSDTHRCVVVKQVSLFYRMNVAEIEILTFWDNRKNPSKLIL